MGDGITLYGTLWCSDCKQAKRFFGDQRIQYTFVNVDEDKEGLRFVEKVNDGKQIIPTITFDDGSVLVEPSNADLAAKLGLQTRARRTFYDLIVAGSGPAGLTAALYAAREGIETLVIERAGVGGQAGVTERLDNFPGFPEGISGAEFADRLRQQAERFGVEILSAQEVEAVGQEGMYRRVHCADGQEYRAWAVLLALGSTYRRLGAPGEEDFIGAGVHFCATCDGPFYRGRDVLVIGGGNSACEEGLFLTKFASKVTIITRGDLTASRIIQAKVRAHPKMEVIAGHTVAEFCGDKRLESVVIRDAGTGATRSLTPGGVFVFIGLSPNTSLAKGTVDLDQWGFIVAPVMETSQSGIFAAGDCRQGSTKQAASAAGEGAAAALMIRRYVEPLASGLPQQEPVAAGSM